jgi:hypothetical protein
MDGEVHFIMTDLTSRTPFSFRSGTDDLTSARYGVQQRGGYVLASAHRWTMDTSCTVVAGNHPECPEWDRVVLLNLAGEVLWDLTFTGRSTSLESGLAAWLAQDGHVVLAGPVARVLVAPRGTTTALPDVRPLAAPVAGPNVPVQLYDADLGITRFAWFQPESGIAPMDLRVGSVPVFEAADFIAFPASTLEGLPVLVHAAPGTLDLAAVPPEVSAQPDWEGSGPYWLYLVEAELLRLHLPTGGVERLPWAPPAGTKQFGNVLIDTEGNPTVVVRDDYRAWVAHSPDGSTYWTPIGLSLGAVEDVRVFERGGTFYVHGRGTQEFFVPTQQWSEAPAGLEPDLLGSSRQLVRPSDDVAVAIDASYDELAISRDGLCAAYWQERDGTWLVMHDVVRGAVVTTIPRTGLHPAIAWFE